MTWLFVIGMGAMLGLALLFAGRRRKEIEAWAEREGLAFSHRADRAFDRQYPEFRCLHLGHSRAAYNIASGMRNGRKLTAFDYRYVTGHGKNRSTHSFSAVIIESRVPLHPLTIRPENAFDKVTAFFGAEDINFESTEFSGAFHVSSPEKKWSYDVLHQRTMEFLLGKPRFNLQFGTQQVICWRNRRFGMQAREDAIDVVEGILDRLPEYVLRQQKGAI